MAQSPPPINFPNYPLKDIPGPHPHDVLCGRGGGTNNHIGNSHWRMLVAANKQLYVTLPKRQKMLLSRSIVNAVRSQNPPGRFLQKDAKSELWYDVGDQRAQEKTSQALREGAPEIRTKMKKGDTAPPKEVAKSNTAAPKLSEMPPPQQRDVASTPPQQQQQAAMNPANFLPHAAFVTAEGANASSMPMTVPPPGSTPVIMYAMPQGMGGMGGMPMYPAMMTPQGMVVPAMQAMPPPFPPPIPAQIPSQKGGGGKGSSASMHPPNTPNPLHTISSPSENGQSSKPYEQNGLGPLQHSPNTPLASNDSDSRPPGRPASQKPGPVADSEETAAMVSGGLEPSGISFGTISMASVDTRKLEQGGTSFGSMMSFTVGSSKIPDMVDGGLEPIGTSFGSLSLNSVDRSNLQRALQPEPIPAPPDATKYAMSYETPTLLHQQRSRGNLLECSDSESDDDDEEDAPNQASKSAEWETLKATLYAHTHMESNEAKMQIPPPPPGGGPFEAVPHTGFDRDFSNVSALSMGEFEDFDQLSTVVEVRGQEGFDSTQGSRGFVVDTTSVIPPPPPSISVQADDDDSVTERERLELMYLARGGGLNP